MYKHGLKIGVVVSYTGDADTGKGLAMHIAAFNPVAVSAEHVPADLVAKEKEIAEASDDYSNILPCVKLSDQEDDIDYCNDCDYLT